MLFRSAAGFQNYEISAYAREGRRAKHNLNYWEFGDYLGVGAGAHSKISFPHRVIRQARYKQPDSYMQQASKGNAVSEEAEINREDLGFEFMINALRLSDGFEVRQFSERTGLTLQVVESALNKAEAKGLLYRDYLKIAPTSLGRRFLNDLQQIFLPD